MSVDEETRAVDYLNYATSSEDQVLAFAHDGDAGMDVIATSEPKIVGVEVVDISGGRQGSWYRIDYIEYETNLSLDLNPDQWVLAVPRSSLTKYNLVLGNSVGVIDSGYRGKILFRFKYIMQPEDLRVEDGRIIAFINEDRIYKRGDRIGQIIVMKHNFVESRKVETLSNTSRGTGGFGSTGA